MFGKSGFLVPLSLAMLAAGDQPWKDKQVPEWTDEDAKLVITASPWARSVTPASIKPANTGQRRGGMGGGRGGGVGIGLPGGMGRRGGMGGGGGRYPGGGNPRGRSNDGSDGDSSSPPSLALRWESALPIQAAELKTHADAPTVDEGHYAIAVYGIPNRMVSGDSKSLIGELKKQAVIKREGKKDLKPSSVQVLRRDEGAVIVYHFPRTAEITAKDKRIEFDAQIARFKFEESFYVEDMIYNGKLEL